MREVADLHAGALHQPPVVLDQRVGFPGQRFDLGGKTPVEPLCIALPHGGQRGAHLAERPQAEQDRSGIDGDHAAAE